ncbi:MAG: nucleotidyltransferase domain-containing protein [Gammaproteobacteria bacterium]|nr:nucleotidyltransferase domain-containing protein [Gammaproteobacteria bacterium]
MGFIEVPALNRKAPSTSFKIQGKQLSVDLLTPMTGKTDTRPVHISSLNTFAEPVRFLDYLLEDTQPAVIVARAGILVNVPAPARYALHKLVTAERRPAAMHLKANKDMNQATQLLSFLLENRAGDITSAVKATKIMPEKFQQQLKNSINKLPAQLSKHINL